MFGGAKKRASNPGTAKMSMERKGGSDFSLKIARCHKCVPVDEARRGQAGSKRHGMKGGRQFLLRPAHFPSSGDGWRRGGQNRRSSIWPGDFCAPRIFVKATCSAFQPELETLERKGRLHALRVEKCHITAQGTSLATTGYVDDFECHLLGAGVCELDRWRPPTATPALVNPRRGATGELAHPRLWRAQRRIQLTQMA